MRQTGNKRQTQSQQPTPDARGGNRPRRGQPAPNPPPENRGGPSQPLRDNAQRANPNRSNQPVQPSRRPAAPANQRARRPKPPTGREASAEFWSQSPPADLTQPEPARRGQPRDGNPQASRQRRAAPPIPPINQPAKAAPPEVQRSIVPAPAYPPATEPPAKADPSWEPVAEWYDSLTTEQGTEFHQRVIVPGVLELLALKPGERALDLGCGQGVVSRAMRHAGAQVTGVDLSPKLIELAQERSAKTIRYLAGDARNLDKLPDASFDAIACVLALDNIDPAEPAFAECSRLLRQGGRLVIVTLHPAFRIPRQSSWLWDDSRKMMRRVMDLYLSPLKIPIDQRPFRQPGQTVTWTYHRPLQAHVNGLAAAGLWTNALHEWPSHKTSPFGSKSSAENRARNEFPLFMALRAGKV